MIVYIRGPVDTGVNFAVLCLYIPFCISLLQSFLFWYPTVSIIELLRLSLIHI